MEALNTFGEAFYGLFQNGATYFISLYVLNLLPWIIIMIAFMHILFKLIGLDRIERFCNLLGKNAITRWILMPVVCMMFSGNPMTYPYARFLPQNQRVAFFDAGISFCHPVTGLFPHSNPGEVFVWLGIASGVFYYTTTMGIGGIEVLGGLAVQYFLLGVVMCLLRSVVTQVIYNAKYKKKYGHAQGTEKAEA
ncbi:MAG: PTS glucitol/sorbitol transporter subunit IIC [Eubacterium aggregans]|uniref:PTS system, glucitol/sorbitol-specific IIC component n=1 Tax=Eubacterium aggregans TaxID=81409 RepID=A0A1H3WZG0_9FIRM|nr:PTS glucitol/sorbitol transporter subunit IIC [Eubacterium aggregans]MDD4692324.1 PTS glucitol/sorbitol transporter subunit IIC [Eubacterium aggregans]MEA5074488.1 PTS glucitol/sorbitol transporter subunit IIC [Eubacterium aggregans]SDZ92565.1 PTS system, glucitol/sorbitol-specific IIC component [Eubacterium aggregans]